MRYENYASSWPADKASVTCDCASVSDCAMLLHGQPAAGSAADTGAVLAALTGEARARSFSYVYVTSGQMPDPWATMPAYMGDLVALAQAVSRPRVPS